MAISKESEAEILRLHYAEKWKKGTIAAQLGLHHTTVERVLVSINLNLPPACQVERRNFAGYISKRNLLPKKGGPPHIGVA